MMYLADVNGTSVACNKAIFMTDATSRKYLLRLFLYIGTYPISCAFDSLVMLYPVFIKFYALTLLPIYCAEVVKVIRPWYACIMCFDLLKGL